METYQVLGHIIIVVAFIYFLMAIIYQIVKGVVIFDKHNVHRRKYGQQIDDTLSTSVPLKKRLNYFNQSKEENRTSGIKKERFLASIMFQVSLLLYLLYYYYTYWI